MMWSMQSGIIQPLIASCLNCPYKRKQYRDVLKCEDVLKYTDVLKYRDMLKYEGMLKYRHVEDVLKHRDVFEV